MSSMTASCAGTTTPPPSAGRGGARGATCFCPERSRRASCALTGVPGSLTADWPPRERRAAPPAGPRDGVREAEGPPGGGDRRLAFTPPRTGRRLSEGSWLDSVSARSSFDWRLKGALHYRRLLGGG